MQQSKEFFPHLRICIALAAADALHHFRFHLIVKGVDQSVMLPHILLIGQSLENPGAAVKHLGKSSHGNAAGQQRLNVLISVQHQEIGRQLHLSFLVGDMEHLPQANLTGENLIAVGVVYQHLEDEQVGETLRQTAGDSFCLITGEMLNLVQQLHPLTAVATQQDRYFTSNAN